MSIHICTEDSLLQGGIEMELDCFICGRRCMHKVHYIGAKCSNCNQCIDVSECTYGCIMMRQRELIKLSRKELSAWLGYSSKTIKKYEWTRPSKLYANSLLNLIKTLQNEPIQTKTKALK